LKKNLTENPPNISRRVFKIRFGDGTRSSFRDSLKTALGSKKWEELVNTTKTILSEQKQKNIENIEL
jgi:hypothetical protein